MAPLQVLILRTLFTETATRGHYIVDDTHLGYTLEDRIRVPGEKVPGETCIPAGTFRLVLAPSPRFKRDLPRLLNVPEFDGILFHSGNRPKDTEGCLLIARHRKASDWIFGSLEADLIDRLKKAGGVGSCTIINGPGWRHAAQGHFH